MHLGSRLHEKYLPEDFKIGLELALDVKSVDEPGTHLGEDLSDRYSNTLLDKILYCEFLEAVESDCFA